MSELALFGGPKAMVSDPGDMFTWPIITQEDEDAIVEVLHNRAMSGTDITMKFEEEFAQWMGVKYALGFSSGTASLQGAMFGIGLGRGDELICPATTYWASGLQAYTLGATLVFADVDPETFCIDPKDIERCIGPKTKAIVAVHYLGHPCDMDPIMEIAKKHNLKVIEDVSHAQGALYKGKMVGTFGDVAAMSLMSGKSFACGEAGILVTNDREVYERAIALGHYERFENENIQTEELKPFCGLPLGGYKYRMHQMSSAMARVQLKYYDERCVEIRKAMNYFWDLLEGVPGIRAHRTNEAEGTTMGGWYAAHGRYVSEELGGLSVTRFLEALDAEGLTLHAGLNECLSTHALFKFADVYHDGQPTRVVFADRDVRDLDADLPNSESLGAYSFEVPWFKHYYPAYIEECANAIKKVVRNYQELLPGDPGNPENLGGWHFFSHSKKA